MIQQQLAIQKGALSMSKMYEIREIIKLVDLSSIQEFELEHEDTRIVIRKKVSGDSQLPATFMKEGDVPGEPGINTFTPPVAEVPSIDLKQPEAKVETRQPSVLEVTPDLTENDLHKVVSPMVGTFYSAPEPGAAPFVKEGQKISAGTVVCILEAMKLFNEIEAEVNGEIAKILVKDGDLVEYGQPLFLVRTL